MRRLLAVGFLLVSLAARAEANRWTSLGPEGKWVRVYAIAVVPGQPSVVLMAMTSSASFRFEEACHFYRSSDGGDTWNCSDEGLGGHGITALSVDPRHPSTVYAGTGDAGVFKSVDGGRSWAAANTGLTTASVPNLAIDPNLPTTIYAAAAQFDEPTGSYPVRLYKTNDGGETWVDWGHGLPTSVSAVAVDPTNSSVLYVTDGASLFKSTNGGLTWSQLSQGIDLAVVAVAPTTPPTILVSSAGVYWSRDGGATWAPGVGVNSSVDSFAVDPVTPSTIYAVGFYGLHKTIDAGQSWTHIEVPGEGAVLAIDPLSPATLYLGSFESGVFRSRDAGASVAAANRGLSGAIVDALAAAPDSVSSIYAGFRGGISFDLSLSGGVFKRTLTSPDWTDTNGSKTAPTGLVVDPTNPQTVYAMQTSRGLIKTTDGGQTWLPMNNGMTGDGVIAIGATALSIDPHRPSTIYAGASSCSFSYLICNGTIFKTNDGAENWTRLLSAPALAMTSIAVDPATPTTVYAGAGGFQGGGLFKTSDAGSTWTMLGGFPSSLWTVLSVTPGSTATIYAAGGRLYRSPDGGGTSSVLSRGLPPDTDSWFVTDLVVHPLAPQVLYLGTTKGVYRSANGGDDWWPLNEGLTDLYVRALALSKDSSTLYAGTSSRGVFQISPESGQTGPCLPSVSALCLEGARFHVDVSWRTTAGNLGAGQALPLTSNTGAFWFFSPDNLELVIKILDGRSINGKFWVFYGALSNVEYTITVTDTQTGAVKTYFNPQGQLASVADVSAF